MPIAAALSVLAPQLASVHKLKIAGNSDLIAQLFTVALIGAVPMGLYPPGPSPSPLVPSGSSILQNMVKQAHELDKAGGPDKSAKLIAQGISQLVSNVPPAGLSKLELDIEQSLSLEIASVPDTVGMLQAQAIVSYYSTAGVI